LQNSGEGVGVFPENGWAGQDSIKIFGASVFDAERNGGLTMMKIIKGFDQVEFMEGNGTSSDYISFDIPDDGGSREVEITPNEQKQFLKWFVAHMD
jgi:hypothetical protein